MKNTKRFMALLLTLVLVFGSMSSAFAAVNEDVVDTDFEVAVGKLSALGIMEGYPDGTFRPEGQITRAEFAKIAVLALGLNDAAEVSKSNTIFTDVDAFHWAAGYINVAVDRGILKGYPDGTYKPSNPLSNAEAITILTRLIGLGPIVDKEGNWPANYITRANILGVLDDVYVSSVTNATRGNAAKMLVNTLVIEKWGAKGYDDDGSVNYGPQTGVTLLNDNLDVNQYKEVVASGYDTDDNEVTLSGLGSFEVLSGDDLYDLYLNELTVWVDEEDDELIFAEITSDYYIDAVEMKPGSTDKIKLVDMDKTFEMANGFNVDITASDSTADYLDGKSYGLAKVVLDNKNDVVRVDAYELKDMIVVDSVDEDVVTTIEDEEVDFDGFTVFKDGKFASVEDFVEGDVVIINYTTDVAEVYNEAIVGEITAIFVEGFDVDDEEYLYFNDKLGITAQYVNEDGDLDDMDKDAAEQFEDTEEEVAIYLDRFGKLVYVTGDLGVADTDTVAGVLLQDVVFDEDFSDVYARFVFVNEEGTKVTEVINLDDLSEINDYDTDSAITYTGSISSVTNFTVTDDDKGALVVNPANELSRLNVVEFVYNDDGDIVEINTLTEASVTAGFKLDEKFINGQRISSSTPIFVIADYSDYFGSVPNLAKSIDAGDVSVVDWSEAEFDTLVGTDNSYYHDGGTSAKYFVATQTNADEDKTKIHAFRDTSLTVGTNEVTRLKAWANLDGDEDKHTFEVDKLAIPGNYLELEISDETGLVTGINAIATAKINSEALATTGAAVDISGEKVTVDSGTVYRLTDDAIILFMYPGTSDVKQLRDINLKDYTFSSVQFVETVSSAADTKYVDMIVVDVKPVAK